MYEGAAPDILTQTHFLISCSSPQTPDPVSVSGAAHHNVYVDVSQSLIGLWLLSS